MYVLVWHVGIWGRILPVSTALGSAAHDSLYVEGEVAIGRPCTNLWAVGYGFPEWSGVWRRTIRILGWADMGESNVDGPECKWALSGKILVLHCSCSSMAGLIDPLGGVSAGKNTFQSSGLSIGIPLPSFLSGWTSSGWPARACWLGLPGLTRVENQPSHPLPGKHLHQQRCQLRAREK